MMLKRLSSDTGHPIEASSSHKTMILSICTRVSPPSLSLSSPNCHHSSAPTPMECYLKRVLSMLKYSWVLFLLAMQIKRILGRILAIICQTFVSFSTQTARFFTYSVTFLISSGVVAIHPGDCPVAGSMGFVIMPLRYLLSPQLAVGNWHSNV